MVDFEAWRWSRRYVFCLLVILGPSARPVAAADGVVVRLRIHNEWLEGQALAASTRSVQLLTRDGFLREIDPKLARDYRRLPGPFRGYQPNEMRSRLQKEFGKRFQVSGTGHYLVVHPVGQRDLWARRFEELYRSFHHYFGTRGFRPQPPQFPLVAVVFPDRNEFLQYARSTGARLPSQAIGYYSPISNRILLYDLTAGRSSANWYQNAETIIHEATHQTAYNTGIHARYAPPPRWVAEGLATMFEARGVWDAPHYRDRRTRINRRMLAAFQRYAKTRPRGSLKEFLSSDRLFSSDPQSAYAEAWALTFYLSETQPQKYIRYLKRTATRTPFTRYTAGDRWSDFAAVFGRNLDLFEAHYLRFISQLRP